MKRKSTTRKMVMTQPAKQKKISKAISSDYLKHVSEKKHEEMSAFIQKIKEFFIGHSEYIEELIPYIEIGNAGLGTQRPLCNILLSGPPATGKTYLPQVLARVLHQNSPNKPLTMLRIDCTEFTQEHEVAKLTGAPPGYVGFESNSSIFSTPVMETLSSEHSPIKIILFDEIDKAHPTMMKYLLNVMDNGMLRLGCGQKVSFKNCMIFFTSNFASREIMEELSGGCGLAKYAGLKGKMNITRFDKYLRKRLLPEFISRLDKIFIFRPYTDEEKRAIIHVSLNLLKAHLKKTGLSNFFFNFDESVVDHILLECSKPNMDLRDLKRLVFTDLLYNIAKALPIQKTPTYVYDYEDMSDAVKMSDLICCRVSVINGKYTFLIEKAASAD
ncbi:MAG: AAA family ATPase [Patescibacteria group bacterium]|nr:AAA family ATPase [Patescibacteria group bacterium]